MKLFVWKGKNNLDQFKLFNKQFYIDKINQEIEELNNGIKKDQEYIEKLPRLLGLKKGTAEYTKIKGERSRSFCRIYHKYERIQKLQKEIERYQNLEI